MDISVNILYYLTVTLASLAAVLFFMRRPLVSAYRSVLVILLLLHGTFIALRWYSSAHPPILGSFEETLSASWMLMLFMLVFDKRGKLVALTMPIVATIMLYGLRFDFSTRPYIITEKSLWIDFHVLFAWISYSFYTLSFAFAIKVLLSKTDKFNFLRGKLVYGEEDLSGSELHRWLFYGFTAQAIMFALGSYHSSLLNGLWWTWDPVEFLAVASWLAYSVPLHGLKILSWNMVYVARSVVVAFVVTVVLYWGLVYFPGTTFHIFDISIKTHSARGS